MYAGWFYCGKFMISGKGSSNWPLLPLEISRDYTWKALRSLQVKRESDQSS